MSTVGVSRLPSQPRSSRTLATIPEEETAVIPAIANAATGPQPSRRAAIAPGAALRARSTAPVGDCRRRLVTNSPAVYSSPRTSSSKTTPISAPMWMKSSAVTSGYTPPFPNARPASR